MAWVTPETWTDDAAPVGSDFNRMEGNDLENHNLILGEASARLIGDQTEASLRDAAILVETNARIADVNAEEAARIAADTSVLSGNPNFYIENRSSDPTSPAIGHMWLRIDL